MNEPVLVSMRRAEQLTSLSRATLDRMVRDQTLRSVKVRGRRLIPLAAIRELAGLPTAPQNEGATGGQ